MQRRLLLSLKAAREEFEEDGEVSRESFERWLESIADVPARVLLDNLKFVGRFAYGFLASTDRKAHEAALQSVTEKLES